MREIRKLRAIAHVTDLLYRQRVVEIAQSRRRHMDLAESAARVARFIDAPSNSGSALSEIALVRASRLRRELSIADRDLETAFEEAGAALAIAKGAVRWLRDLQAKIDSEASEKALDEILEVTRRASSTRLK